MAGVVVGLRALSEDAEVVARQPVQAELLGQHLEIVALGVPDVEPEVLAACEPLLHLGQVDQHAPELVTVAATTSCTPPPRSTISMLRLAR